MFTHRTGAVLSMLATLAFFAPACADAPAKGPLPRLVDLGATKCIPCKKMAPILEELKKDYAGIVDVMFVDVWKEPNAGKPYNIRAIPTQVFFDLSGKEVFRHVGFFSREEIEKVFQEKLGVTPVRKPKQEGAKESSSLLHWEPPVLASGERTYQTLGRAPDAPPLRIQIVYASVACQCVMERCQRHGQILHGLLDPLGASIVQTWIDRTTDTGRADALVAEWGLEYLPAVALVDADGEIYYGDDEEIDLGLLKSWIGESL